MQQSQKFMLGSIALLILAFALNFYGYFKGFYEAPINSAVWIIIPEMVALGILAGLFNQQRQIHAQSETQSQIVAP